jgi:hypothetical protein
MKSEKSAGFTNAVKKNLKDLFDSYQERGADIMSPKENTQNEATDIVAKAQHDGKSFIDEAVVKK